MNWLNKNKSKNSGEDQGSNNTWPDAMKDVDDFSEHMRKIETSKTEESVSEDESHPVTAEDFRATRVQRALKKVGAVESRGDEIRFESDLENLDPKDALRLLVFINGAITGEKKYDRRTFGYGVWGGAEVSGHLSPAPEVQETAIEETFEALKEIKDNHKRAALAYYMVNHLHLFGDGNGRTARTLYEVFDKKNFNVVGGNYMHQTNSEDEVGDRGSFIAERGLLEDKVVSSMILDLVKSDLVDESKLPDKMLSGNYSLNLPSSNRPMPDVYLTRDAEQNLDYLEKRVVRNAFFEKPIATTALGIMLKKKHNFSWAVSEGSRENNYDDSVYFEIENKDKRKAKEVFDSWTADDYRDFCGTVKDLQLRQVRKMIDVFRNEDKYKTPDGKTYADVLSGQ